MLFEIFTTQITQDSSEQDVASLIRSNKKIFHQDINDLCERVRSGEDIENILSKLHEGIINQYLFDTIEKELRSEAASYLESEYIRVMNNSEYMSFISYSLENLIVYKAPEATVMEQLQINKQQFGYLLKFLNTAFDMVVIRRFTRDNFTSSMFGMFRLDEDKTNYTWNLFEENKSTLTTIALLNSIVSIRKVNTNMEIIKDCLWSLIDE